MKVLFRVSEFADLNPVEYEVLPNETSITDRNYKLKKGEVFAKFKIMTRMLVMTKEGEVLIKSVIFELTDRTVKIKGKILLPINCIKEVTYEY